MSDEQLPALDIESHPETGNAVTYHPESVVKHDSHVVAIWDDGTKDSFPWWRVVGITEEYGGR